MLQEDYHTIDWKKKLVKVKIIAAITIVIY